MSAFAAANIAAWSCGTRPPIAIERRSMSFRSSRPGTTRIRRSRKPSLVSARCSTASSGNRPMKIGAPSGARPRNASTCAPPSASISLIGKQGIEPRRAIAQYRHVARDQERARLLAGPQASNLDRVLASIRSAIKPIDDIAEAFESRQDLTSFKGSEPGAPRSNLTEAQPEAAAQG